MVSVASVIFGLQRITTSELLEDPQFPSSICFMQNWQKNALKTPWKTQLRESWKTLIQYITWAFDLFKFTFSLGWSVLGLHFSHPATLLELLLTTHTITLNPKSQLSMSRWTNFNSTLFLLPKSQPLTILFMLFLMLLSLLISSYLQRPEACCFCLLSRVNYLEN